MAGAYVWGMKENGFRNSYGIVTAMFGLTIIGCWIFRVMLVRLNKRLAAGDLSAAGWTRHADVAKRTAELRKGGAEKPVGQKEAIDFRYLI